jgi:hypothetical protein
MYFIAQLREPVRPPIPVSLLERGNDVKLRIVLAAFTVASAIAQPPQDRVTVKQGETSMTLNDAPQKVLFVKSESDDPKAAIANTLITQVGLNLLTMGMGSQMIKWNPYMGEAFSQFTNVGKGLFTGHGTDVKGFEYDTLAGLTSSTTLKPQPFEILLPLDPFRPSADFNVDDVQPVLLHLETRPEDQVRMLASRRVVIKQEKKGRFDLKPKSERQETAVNERPVAIQFERQPGNILHITSAAPLETGEYALVLRAKGENGAQSRNIPLKPVSPAPQAAAAAPPMPIAPPKSMFGMLKGPKQPTPAPEQSNMQVGFLAWDFRVIE